MTDRIFNKLLDKALEQAGVIGIIREFIAVNEINCPEAIYQTDRVSVNALEFIEDLCNAVGYYKREEGED